MRHFLKSLSKSRIDLDICYCAYIYIYISHLDKHYLDICHCIYIYMFVGCVVLVINKSTTKQNNIRHST